MDKATLIDLVRKGKLRVVLESLKELTIETSQSNHVSLLISRFERNEKDYFIDNVIGKEDYNRESNIVTKALLNLIDQIFMRELPQDKFDVSQKNIGIYDIEVVDERLIKALDIYIDKGEFTSAKIILLSRYGSFYDLPLVFKLKLIEIEQKYGLLKDARKHIDYLLEHSSQIEDEKKLLKIKILDFRLSSQERDVVKLVSTYENLLALVEQLDELSFKCTILNRTGVAFAVLKDKNKSRSCFEESKRNAIQLNLDHSLITANCLHAMCALVKKVPIDGDPLEILINSQIEYLQKDINRYIWQANAFKSSVQCLFSEAAYYLLMGQNSKGNFRLCIANQLVTLTKASSTTEGYAELVSVLADVPTIMKQVELAMNGFQNRNAFQYEVKMPIGELLIETALVYEAVNESPSDLTWGKVRELINNYDHRH